MNHVFAVVIEGRNGAIRTDADRALMDVADKVWGHDAEFNLYGKMQSVKAKYEASLGPDMMPSLAHMISLELTQGNGMLDSAIIEITDTDSDIGNPGLLASLELGKPNDPSFYLMSAIIRMRQEDITVEDAVYRLRMELSLSAPYGTNLQVMTQLRGLCLIQEKFGYPSGDPRNLFTADMTGKEMKMTLERLPELAEERLRFIVADMMPASSPAP